MTEDRARTNPAPGFAMFSGHELRIEPGPNRVRVTCAGETVADSDDVLLVTETGQGTVAYIPKSDVRMDLMTQSDFFTACRFKGHATYWSLTVGDTTESSVAWSYDTPYDEAAAIKDHVAFYTHRMDGWEEEPKETPAPVDPAPRAD